MTRDSLKVAGAVVSLVDSLGTSSVSVLTDEYGRFEIRAPHRGTWRLRTEAVGFGRVLSFPFVLASVELVQREVHLVDVTVRLHDIVVRDRLQCDVRPAEGTRVAILWDEARKSLAAAALSAVRAPPLAFDHDELEYDATFRWARTASRSTTMGHAEQAFRSDSPRALRRLGYARRMDTTTVYYGPDANVMLSDDFAATHCFRLVPEDPASIRRIGIAFAPVHLPPDQLDVVGTLWLDRETFALDRIDFRYEPLLSADFPDSTFGGRVRFVRLATGHVIVSRWELRMPVFAPEAEQRVARAGTTSQVLVRAERRESVVGIRVARGAVRAFDAPPEPLPPISAPARRSAGPPSCVGVTPVGGYSGAVLGSVRDARGRAVSGARVRASWHQAMMTGGRTVFREEWTEAGGDPQGRFALCALPRDVTVTVSARTPEAASPRARLVLAAGAVSSPLTLVVAPLGGARSPSPGAVHGRILGRDARPVADVEVRILPRAQRILTDSSGEFRLEVAAGMSEFFVRRMGYAPQMAAVAVAAGDTASIVLTLAPAVQLLAPATVEASVTALNVAGFELRRAAEVGGGTFIPGEEIRRREASTVPLLLRTLGRVLVEESGATGESRAYGRGGTNPADVDRCAMRILLDATLLPDGSPLGALPPLSEIAAIEVYRSTGAIPAQFSFAQAKCGLIVVWTRDGTLEPMLR